MPPGAWLRLAIVGPPNSGVCRIERASVSPFSPVDWLYADAVTGTFDGRFDDPRPRSPADDESRFRIVYAATTAVGALAETIAHMRGAPGSRVRLDVKVNDSARDSISGAATVDATGVVQSEWHSARQLRTTSLAPHLRFADLWDAASLVLLRERLAPRLLSLGFTDLDLAAMSGATERSRQFTRACARYIYELTDDEGRPVFTGIRYRSRWGEQWECWAIFSDRLVHAPGTTPTSRPIPADDPDLVACAELLGLTIAPDDR